VIPVEWPLVTVSTATHYGLDDLRRFAASLAAGLGVTPTRASVLASHLLWFDAAGASDHGIASLSDWLDRIERKDVDPLAEGRVVLEHSGTAVFDSQGGLAPLILAKAAGIAAEKARDVGVGIVRVRGLGPTGPAAAAVADLAVGPFVGLIAGPGPSLALAVPMPEGLPALFDSALAVAPGDVPAPAIRDRIADWAPWISAVSGPGGWTILALAVWAMEPLETLHNRMAGAFSGPTGGGPGTLLPGPWEARRRDVRERGIILEERALAGLGRWSERLRIPWPAPLGG
jgi:LDH2 family malate/lactate/ureidoglycolate dehydrogenase